jgi:hypothetical protein
MTSKNCDSRCKSLAKSGKPCQAAPTAGGLCFFHANPNKASELGRKGGRSKRYSAGENAAPLPTLDSVLAVREASARVIADVYSGRLNPRIATSLASLLNLQLRAIETVELQQRVVKLERLLAGMDTEQDREGKSRPTTRRKLAFVPPPPSETKTSLDSIIDAGLVSTCSEPAQKEDILWSEPE